MDTRNLIIDQLTEFSPDAGNFVYLVHGINKRHMVDHVTLTRHLERLHDSSYFYNASLVADTNDPDQIRRLGQKDEEPKFISKTGFYHSIGLVIRPEPGDIKVSWYGDVSTPTDQDRFRLWVQRHNGKILAPYPILTMDCGWFNHIVLQGNSDLIIQGIVVSGRRDEFGHNLERLLTTLSTLFPDQTFPQTRLRSRYYGYGPERKSVCPNQSRHDFETFHVSSMT